MWSSMKITLHYLYSIQFISLSSSTSKYFNKCTKMKNFIDIHNTTKIAFQIWFTKFLISPLVSISISVIVGVRSFICSFVCICNMYSTNSPSIFSWSLEGHGHGWCKMGRSIHQNLLCNFHQDLISGTMLRLHQSTKPLPEVQVDIPDRPRDGVR